MVRKSKSLILTIPLMAVLVGVITYQYGYLRVQEELAGIKEEQAMKQKTLEKYVALISEKPGLEKELAALKELRKAEDTKLIEGQTPSLAAATLQESVKGIVTSRGGTISSERVGKPEDFDAFKLITVSLDAVFPDARVLSDVLFSIETRTPYLVVKELDVRVRNLRDPRDLMVKLDNSALLGGK